MTQRPQALVGEAVVVARLLLRAEPDPAELIGRVFRRDTYPVVSVHDLAIGRATAMRNPRAGAGAHDRFECGDQAARRPPDRDFFALTNVDVGLAVGDHDDLLPAQLAVQ